MISKDKILNGYIDNQNKELQKEWYKACEFYGFNMEYCERVGYLYKLSFIDGEGDVDFCNVIYPQVDRKTELTLSDFKPKKTRTEWVKVDDSIFDLRPDFECGELYFKGPDGRYKKVLSSSFLAASLECKSIYRKVEKVIDWRVEATIFISDNSTTEVEYTWAVDGVNLSDNDFIKLCHLVAESTEKPQ